MIPVASVAELHDFRYYSQSELVYLYIESYSLNRGAA